MDTRRSLGILTAAAGAWLAAAGTAEAQARDSLPAGVTPAMVQEGRGVFLGKGMCTACHGPAALGGVGPNLRDTTWLHGDGTYPAVLRVVVEGVPAARSRSGMMMPPRGGAGLSDEETRAVAAYVWSLGGTGPGRARDAGASGPARRAGPACAGPGGSSGARTACPRT
jgi:mono/diheme cytochrome c family protein